MRINELRETLDWQTIINSRAQSYLKQKSRSLALYRGIPTPLSFNGVGFIKKVRKESRNPLNTTKRRHNFINEFFIDKFNIPFRNGMFATSDARETLAYGDTYEVFPLDNFKFCWSPKVHDLTMFLVRSLPKKKVNGWEIPEKQDDLEFKQKLFAILEDADYQITDLAKAMESGNEIMFWCDEYLVLEEDLFDED